MRRFTWLLGVWVTALVTGVTIKVFFDPVEIPAGTATAYGILLGLPPVVYGLIKWARSKDQ